RPARNRLRAYAVCRATPQAQAWRRSSSPSSSPSSTSPSKLEGNAIAGSATGAAKRTGGSALALRVYVGGGTGTGAQPEGSLSAGESVSPASSTSITSVATTVSTLSECGVADREAEPAGAAADRWVCPRARPRGGPAPRRE